MGIPPIPIPADLGCPSVQHPQRRVLLDPEVLDGEQAGLVLGCQGPEEDSGGQVYLHTVPFSVHKDFNIWLISLEMTSFKQGFNS